MQGMMMQTIEIASVAFWRCGFCPKSRIGVRSAVKPDWTPRQCAHRPCASPQACDAFNGRVSRAALRA